MVKWFSARLSQAPGHCVADCHVKWGEGDGVFWSLGAAVGTRHNTDMHSTRVANLQMEIIGTLLHRQRLLSATTRAVGLAAEVF